MTQRIINIVGFQACWFACVMSAAAGHPWLGVWCIGAMVVFQLERVRGWKRDFLLLLGSAVLGYVADSLLVFWGVMVFPPQTWQGGPSPLWMIALWVNFTVTLNYSLSWVRDHLGWAAILGLVGGPLSYRAGAAFEAVYFPHPDLALTAIGVEWLISLPLLCLLARYLNRLEKLA